MAKTTAQATIKTNHGDIAVDLYGEEAPTTVENFIGLSTGEKEWENPETGEKIIGIPLYSGVIFHRVIPNFMIQGGDPLGKGTGGPGYQFDDEISQELTFNQPYMLAMANAGQRAGRGTNGSQFFITTEATPWLLGKHSIFGEVKDSHSRNVVDAINSVPAGAMDRPLEDVVIERIEITLSEGTP